MKLKASESKQIKACGTISGTLINSLFRGLNSFLDIGRFLGSSLRRFINNKSCSI
ncbi:MAG: hypothetical protein RSA10_00880 [Bacilli bacterium]